MQLFNVVSDGKVLNKKPFKNIQKAFQFRKKVNGSAAIVRIKECQ